MARSPTAPTAAAARTTAILAKPNPIEASTNWAPAMRTPPTSRRNAQRGAQNVGSSGGQSMPLSQPSSSHSTATSASAPTPGRSIALRGRLSQAIRCSRDDLEQISVGVEVDPPQPLARLAQPEVCRVLLGIGNHDELQPFVAHQLTDA